MYIRRPLNTMTKRSSVGMCRVALIALLIGGAVWLWKDVIEDRVIPKRWGVVEPGRIYRSGQLSAALVKRTLAEHRIKVIVALLAEEPDNADHRAEVQAACELGIELKRFPLRGDGTGDLGRYADALAAIVEADRAHKPVLVHCAAGAQRTGGAIAFYRLLVQKRSPESVLKELKRYDHDPDDNPALLEYINENIDRLATMLEVRGVIEQAPESLTVLAAR